MELSYFKRMFQYDRWANMEALKALQSAQQPPAQAVRWLAHLAGAGHTWLARVRGTECALAIWPDLTPEQCEEYLTALGEGWHSYFEALTPAELGASAIYSNSRGDQFSTAIVDVLTQVLTHGAYHRGQIAAAMRACGETPAATDYIVAQRKGVLEG